MRRREAIALIGGAAIWPFSARAQQSEPMRRIGVLVGTADSDPDEQARVSAFTRALGDLGWKEGTNITIQYRWAAGDVTRLRTHAAEFARLALDAVLTSGTPATMALRQAAPSTPLVFVNVTEPIRTGLISSLAYPGGNITGFANFEDAMGGKWLELLKAIAPGTTHVAILFNPDNPAEQGPLHSIEAVGPTLGMQVAGRPAHNAEEFEQTIKEVAAEPNSGVLVLWDFLTLAHRVLIAQLTVQYRLPSCYGMRDFATSGGLISYGVDSIDLFRRSATYVDRILKGARPADLPVQEPTKLAQRARPRSKSNQSRVAATFAQCLSASERDRSIQISNALKSRTEIYLR